MSAKLEQRSWQLAHNAYEQGFLMSVQAVSNDHIFEQCRAVVTQIRHTVINTSDQEIMPIDAFLIQLATGRLYQAQQGLNRVRKGHQITLVRTAAANILPSNCTIEAFHYLIARIGYGNCAEMAVLALSKLYHLGCTLLLGGVNHNGSSSHQFFILFPNQERLEDTPASDNLIQLMHYLPRNHPNALLIDPYFDLVCRAQDLAKNPEGRKMMEYMRTRNIAIPKVWGLRAKHSDHLRTIFQEVEESLDHYRQQIDVYPSPPKTHENAILNILITAELVVLEQRFHTCTWNFKQGLHTHIIGSSEQEANIIAAIADLQSRGIEARSLPAKESTYFLEIIDSPAGAIHQVYNQTPALRAAIASLLDK